MEHIEYTHRAHAFLSHLNSLDFVLRVDVFLICVYVHMHRYVRLYMYVRTDVNMYLRIMIEALSDMYACT